ncbi:MAG: TIGR02147 family protein [Bdellovibrionia bacterium]
MMTSVYSYQSSRQFLLDQVNRWQNASGGDSIRNLAKRMKISHTLLVMLIQGKRPLRVKHAPALALGFGLSASERIYLQALIQSESAKDVEEKQLCQLWLSELHPARSQVNTRLLDEFELVSNWVHMAILSICEIKDFDPRPEAIAARLGGRVTSVEVRSALERLKSLGLIRFEKEGRFVPTQSQVTTQDDVASQGVRNYYKQVSDLAKEAVERQTVEQREFQGFAFAVARHKIPLAKEMIRKFRAQFLKAMESDVPENGYDDVYQMNIQMFQLTESPVRQKRTEDEGVDENKTRTKKTEKYNVYSN